MTEKGDNMSAVGNQEDSPSSFISEIRKLRSDILNKLNQQTTELEEIKKIAEQNHAGTREKFQSIESLISENHMDRIVDSKDLVGSTDLPSSLPLSNPTEKTPKIVKSFVLRHVFKNVEEFEKEKYNRSEREEHFGVKWYITVIHKDNFLQFYLFLDHPEDDWEIETEFDLKLTGPRNSDVAKAERYCFKESCGWGYDDFLDWEEVKKNYLDDGKLTAEAHVKIIKAKGFRKEKFRSFDESVKEVSDIVLVVQDQKFYAHRTYLAAQSSFFKALFLGNFAESKKSEVTLTGIDPEDFHFFLEVLYGELAIDESNVEGIALLADMYDAPTAIRRCEEFMLNNSKKNLKRKLQIADQYHLGALKKMCLAEIRTSSDLKSVVPNNVRDLEHSTVVALLEKAISMDA